MSILEDFRECMPPNLPDAWVRLFGAPGERGLLIIQYDGQEWKVKLSVVAYAVVLAMAEQSVHDAKLPKWVPRGFLTRKQLEQRVAAWKIRQLSPHYVVKHMHRARVQAVKQHSQAGESDSRVWVRRLLESNEELGAYRLSVPPEQVYVHPYSNSGS